MSEREATCEYGCRDYAPAEYRTEIMINGELIRVTSTRHATAVRAALEAYFRFGLGSEIDGVREEDLPEHLHDAFADDDRVAWVEVALPVVHHDNACPEVERACPGCGVIGGWTDMGAIAYCEPCGYGTGSDPESLRLVEDEALEDVAAVQAWFDHGNSENPEQRFSREHQRLLLERLETARSVRFRALVAAQTRHQLDRNPRVGAGA